jgi:hypothetical protein
MPEPIVTKLGTYIMALELISTAYLKILPIHNINTTPPKLQRQNRFIA